jgi:hypothetical protein
VGQKVHPYGFRLGFNKTWKSRWFADRDYAKLLHEDLALRADLKKRFAHAGVPIRHSHRRGPLPSSEIAGHRRSRVPAERRQRRLWQGPKPKA